MKTKRLKPPGKPLPLVFVLALLLSVLTAIPVGTQLSSLDITPEPGTMLHEWILNALLNFREMTAGLPSLSDGSEWPALAYVTLAMLFTGPQQEPAEKICSIQFIAMPVCRLRPLLLVRDTSGTSNRVTALWYSGTVVYASIVI